MSGGYAVASTAKYRRIPKIRGANQVKQRAIQYTENRSMKLSIKERIRNWLMRDDHESNLVYATGDCEGPSIASEGFRLNVYGASGGTIIETTKYDRKNDENRHSLYVVTEDKDLGEELSKIITMEQLR
jgi:hypothetical protein